MWSETGRTPADIQTRKWAEPAARAQYARQDVLPANKVAGLQNSNLKLLC